MFYKELSRDHCYYTYINLKLPTLYGWCCYREYLKWDDMKECMFDGNSYSEQDKVKFATRTFNDDAFDLWNELKTCRCFYPNKVGNNSMETPKKEESLELEQVEIPTVD